MGENKMIEHATNTCSCKTPNDTGHSGSRLDHIEAQMGYRTLQDELRSIFGWRERGLRGNVTTFEMNVGDIAKMLEGQLFPCSPSILPSLISVAFIGRGKLPPNWLKKTFRIRRSRVHAALVWLKANNPLYSHVNIDSHRLNALPEDGIPREILATVRVERDAMVAEVEREGYAGGDEDEDELEEEVAELRTGEHF